MKLIRAVLLLTALAGICGAGSCLNDCYAQLRACKRTCGHGAHADSACYVACIAAYNTCSGGCPQ